MNDRQELLQAATWLQELQSLITVRKQARWQLLKAAGEHKRTWQDLVDIYDNRIQMKERQLAQTLDVPGFRAKKEF